MFPILSVTNVQCIFGYNNNVLQIFLFNFEQTSNGIKPAMVTKYVDQQAGELESLFFWMWRLILVENWQMPLYSQFQRPISTNISKCTFTLLCSLHKP